MYKTFGCGVKVASQFIIYLSTCLNWLQVKLFTLFGEGSFDLPLVFTLKIQFPILGISKFF